MVVVLLYLVWGRGDTPLQAQGFFIGMTTVLLAYRSTKDIKNTSESP